MNLTTTQSIAMQIVSFLRAPTLEFVDIKDIVSIQKVKNAFDEKITSEYKDKVKGYIEAQREQIKPFNEELMRFKRGNPPPTKEDVQNKSKEINEAYAEVIKPFRDEFLAYEEKQKNISTDIIVNEEDLAVARRFFEKRIKIKDEETGEEKDVINGAKFWPDMETFLEVAKIFKSL